MLPQAPSGFSKYKRFKKMLVGAVGILVLVATVETPSQHCKSLKSPCFYAAEQNAGHKLCSNWRDGNELTR